MTCILKSDWSIERKQNPPQNIHTLSYIRAASQVRVINGVSEVEAQPNTLCSKRTEDIFADSAGKHRESI